MSYTGGVEVLPCPNSVGLNSEVGNLSKTRAKRKYVDILLAISKINENFELHSKICYLERIVVFRLGIKCISLYIFKFSV